MISGPNYVIHNGDSAEVLKSLPDNSVDSIVTDPPAAIGFMSKAWDSDKGGRDNWIAWLRGIMAEALRTLKPGGHALVWAIPRTAHYTTLALEDAGFEIRDVVVHLQSQGFPKSQNIEKAMGDHPDAGRWHGWGSALKPSAEFWVLCRKPLSEKTLVENVLAWGTGGLNIEASRIATSDNLNGGAYAKTITERDDGWGGMTRGGAGEYVQPTGRFPSNAVFSHADGCRPAGTRQVRSGTAVNVNRDPQKTKNVYGDFNAMRGENAGYAGADGLETVEAWDCVDGCPVKALDAQSGVLKSGAQGFKRETAKGHQANAYGKESRPPGTPNVAYADEGGASRFFKCLEADPFVYQAKAPKSEKNEGLGDFKNDHPTVKSVALCEYLIKLITPPGGTVLDPFAGSGTTGVAALKNGFRFVGVEMDPHYFEIVRRRLSG